MRSHVVRVRNPYYLCLALCVGIRCVGWRGTSVMCDRGAYFLCEHNSPIVILHCNKNPIYVFLFWELRVLSNNFHSHVPVSDLYIPRKDQCTYFLQQRIGKSIVGIYKSLTYTWMWKLGGLWPSNSFSGNNCFKFSVLVLCSVLYIKQQSYSCEIKERPVLNFFD